MRIFTNESRILCTLRRGGMLILLGATSLGAGAAAASGAGGATGATAAPTAATAGKPAAPPAAKQDTQPTVKQNIKGLSKEATDPGTLKRIKAHEQRLEEKVERIRDRQRQAHPTAPVADTVDLVKHLDKPDPAATASPPALRQANATEPAKPTAAPPSARPAPPPAGAAGAGAPKK